LGVPVGVQDLDSSDAGFPQREIDGMKRLAATAGTGERVLEEDALEQLRPTDHGPDRRG
jgi:hypothetical protein